MEFEGITEKIIGCAYKVYKTMEYGFGEVVGNFISDIFVEDSIVLELKSVKNLAKAHEVQLVNYLVATEKNVGLLINFGEDKVEIKRKVSVLGYEN